MKDTLEEFFTAQRQRIHNTLRGRCGKMDHVLPDDRKANLVVENRGNATGHAQGLKRRSMDDQAEMGQRPLLPGKRRQVMWKDYERKAGRLAAFKGEDDGREE